jgi:hypothetical protein
MGGTFPSCCLSFSKILLDRRFITLRIPDLNDLLLNLTGLVNYLAWYRVDDPDIAE